LLSAFGHDPTISIPDFEGEVILDPDAIERSSFHLLLHANSLIAVGDANKKDLEEVTRRMHDEVLESESYPDIIYECDQISASRTGEGQYWAALKGSLTLHGVTRSQPVSARLSINDGTLRATGDFSVRQSDYEIALVSAVGGAIRIKDEVKLSFDIVARKQM
jgi:polyisoprenoid-binding protein YceI